MPSVANRHSRAHDLGTRIVPPTAHETSWRTEPAVNSMVPDAVPWKS